MPNYTYRCTECDFEEIITLSISSNPKEKLLCKFCKAEHPNDRPYLERTMVRRPSAFNFNISNGATLGKWYKNQTGKELME